MSCNNGALWHSQGGNDGSEGRYTPRQRQVDGLLSLDSG